MTASSTATTPDPHGFLGPVAPDDDVRRLHDGNVRAHGHVMNLTRSWSHLPPGLDGLTALLGTAAEAAGITDRQRALLVTAGASAVGDSYCSLVWGSRLAGMVGSPAAAAVVGGADPVDLEPAERVLVRWARLVAVRPNDVGAHDVEALRAAGWSDRQVVGLTLFVALRVAFATVNDALGALPDAALAGTADPAVRAAVDFGRPIAPTET